MAKDSPVSEHAHTETQVDTRLPTGKKPDDTPEEKRLPEVMSYAQALKESEENGIPIVRKGSPSPDAQDPRLASLREELKNYGSSGINPDSDVARDVKALQEGMEKGFSSAEQGQQLTKKLQADLAINQDGNNPESSRLAHAVADLLGNFDRSHISGATEIAGSSPSSQSVPGASKGTEGRPHT